MWLLVGVNWIKFWGALLFLLGSNNNNKSASDFIPKYDAFHESLCQLSSAERLFYFRVDGEERIDYFVRIWRILIFGGCLSVSLFDVQMDEWHGKRDWIILIFPPSIMF